MPQSIVKSTSDSVDSSANTASLKPWNLSEVSTPDATPATTTTTTTSTSTSGQNDHNSNTGDQSKNVNGCADLALFSATELLAKLTPEQLNSLRQHLRQSSSPDIGSDRTAPQQQPPQQPQSQIKSSQSNQNDESPVVIRIQSAPVNLASIDPKDSPPIRRIPVSVAYSNKKEASSHPVIQNHSSASGSTSKKDNLPGISRIQSAPAISNSYGFELKDFAPVRPIQSASVVDEYGAERKKSFQSIPGVSSDSLCAVLEKLRVIEQSESKHRSSVTSMLTEVRSRQGSVDMTNNGGHNVKANNNNHLNHHGRVPVATPSPTIKHANHSSNSSSSNSTSKNSYEHIFGQQHSSFHHQLTNTGANGEPKFPNEQFVSSVKVENEKFLKRVDEIRSTLNMMFCSSPISNSSVSPQSLNSTIVTPPMQPFSFFTPSSDSSNNKSMQSTPSYGGPSPKNDRDYSSFKSTNNNNGQSNLNFLRRNSLPISVMRKLITQETDTGGNNSGPSHTNGNRSMAQNEQHHSSSGAKSRENSNSTLSQIPPPNLPLLRRPSFQSIREELSPAPNRRLNDTVSPDSLVKLVKSCPGRVQAHQSAPMNSRTAKTSADIDNNKIDKGKYFVLPEAFWEKNAHNHHHQQQLLNSLNPNAHRDIERFRREALTNELLSPSAGVDDPIISELGMQLSDSATKDKKTPPPSRNGNGSRSSTNKLDQFIASISDNSDRDYTPSYNGDCSSTFDSAQKDKTTRSSSSGCSSSTTPSSASVSTSTVTVPPPGFSVNSNGFIPAGSIHSGSVSTQPPLPQQQTQPQAFAPSFHTLAAIQPNQFGQIFGLNYFNAIPQTTSSSHQAAAAAAAHHPPLPFAHFMTSAGAASIPHSHAGVVPVPGTMTPSQCLALLASSNHQLDPRIMLELGKDDLELKAKDHREAASRVSECESVYSITSFDFKPPADAIYSTKVFLGGVPWDMNNEDMMEVFGEFGAESIQRPGKDVRLSRSSQGLDKAGYLYLLFDSESNVNRLVEACKLEFSENGHKYFYTLISKRSKKEKRVQVIPWNTADSCAVMNPQAKGDQSRTVFLGALHGMMNAASIAQALTLIFGPIEYVSLDTDKYKYPMGSGRAMFTTKEAYYKAISAGFVRVKSERFEKTIQIDPFIDDRNCTRCFYEKGPVFCKTCIKYYCKNCWNLCHLDDSLKNHTILMKSRINSK